MWYLAKVKIKSFNAFNAYADFLKDEHGLVHNSYTISYWFQSVDTLKCDEQWITNWFQCRRVNELNVKSFQK